jgi:predicted DNA-binding transcriptional regulator AlpA
MPTRDFETTRTASGPSKYAGEPRYGRIPDACARYGWSRSRLYRLASEGEVKLVKVGGATFVDYASGDAYMASRPVASIRAPRGAA